MQQDDEYQAEEFNNSDIEKDDRQLGRQKTQPKNSNKKQRNENLEGYEYVEDPTQGNGLNSKPLDKRDRFSNLIVEKQEASALGGKQSAKNKEFDQENNRNQLLDDDLSEIKGREEPISTKSKGNFQFEGLQGDRSQNPGEGKSKQIENSGYLYDFDDEKPQRTLQEQQGQQKAQNGGTTVDRAVKHDQKFGPPASQGVNRSLDLRANATEHSDQVLYEQQHLEKLKEQNKKLKQELAVIAKACDDALIQERERKLNKGKESNKDHPDLIEKQSQIKEQLSKVETLKSQINLMKRQMENTYNHVGVTDKENELRAIQREIARLTDEKESLVKIKTEQNKALDYLRNESEYGTKLKIVSEEMRKAKEENRMLLEQSNENEKVLKKNHEKIVTLEEKVREIKMKIQQKKNEDAHEKQEKAQTLKREKEGKKFDRPERRMPSFGPPKKKERAPSNSNIVVNANVLKELEEKIKQLKEKKAEVEKKFNEDCKQLELEKKECYAQNSKLQTLIKEKEKEVRLNNLRLKEIKKLSRFNALKPIAKSSKSGLESNASEPQFEEGSKHESESKQEKESRSNPSRRSNQVKRDSLKKLDEVPEIKKKPDSTSQPKKVVKQEESNKDTEEIRPNDEEVRPNDDEGAFEEDQPVDTKKDENKKELIDRDEDVEDKA